MSQRGTSCANLYAAAVQHDELCNALHCKSKKYAFTLAEVLITLVIIGIIAALTIPNLLQKYQEQTTVKKVQKFYSNLSNAYALTKKENGDITEWGVTGQSQENSEKVYKLLFKPYFKIAKDCRFINKEKCIGNTYKIENNRSMHFSGSGGIWYAIGLEDGTSVWWRTTSSTEAQYSDLYVYFDVNGAKGPNQSGIDKFDFKIKKDKFYPDGVPTINKTLFKTYCRSQGSYCAAWVVYKGNMDYLHCDGLDWDGKDKCK